MSKKSIADMRQYANIKQLSTTIGFSPRTIRKWVTDPANPLGCYRVGGKLLFDEVEVEQWLRNHKVETIDVDTIANRLLSNFMKEGGKNERHI